MLKKQNILDPEKAKQIWDYNPDTGILTWKVRSGHVMPGRVAGTVVRHKSGHIRLRVRWEFRFYWVYRIAWAIYYGEWPPYYIDHINGDASDNRIINLRLVSGRENAINKKLDARNKSGCHGVYYEKDSGKWRARISSKDGYLSLGRFSCKDDAIAARKEAEIIYGYHQNHGRLTRKI